LRHRAESDAYDPGVIYLLRHGEAERGDGDDAARRLTAEGERQSEAAGRALASLAASVDACLTSPKVRAADTARIACRALGLEPEVAAELSGGEFDANGLAAGRGDVIVVGHEPSLSTEVARLTGAKVKLRKGGVAVVEGGTLQSLLQPAELSAIAAASS
jgi:phosphohistidine phosphatase